MAATGRDIPGSVVRAAAGDTTRILGLASLLSTAPNGERKLFDSVVGAGGIHALARLASTVPNAAAALAGLSRKAHLRVDVARIAGCALVGTLEVVKGSDSGQQCAEFVEASLPRFVEGGLFAGADIAPGTRVPNEAFTTDGIDVPEGPEESIWAELKDFASGHIRMQVAAAQKVMIALLNLTDTRDVPEAARFGRDATRALREVCGPRLVCALVYFAKHIAPLRPHALMALGRICMKDAGDALAAECARAVVLLGLTPSVIEVLTSSVSREANPMANAQAQGALTLVSALSNHPDIPVQNALLIAGYLGGLRAAVGAGCLQPFDGAVALLPDLVVPILSGLSVMIQDTIPEVSTTVLKAPALAAVFRHIVDSEIEAGSEVATEVVRFLKVIDAKVRSPTTPDDAWSAIAMLEGALWIALVDHEFVNDGAEELCSRLLAVMPCATRRCLAAEPNEAEAAHRAGPPPQRSCTRCTLKEPAEGPRFNACSKCGLLYCSRECQLADWKKPGPHKRVCQARTTAHAIQAQIVGSEAATSS